MWEEKLATLCPDDLLPTEREALDGHVASCPFCAVMLAEYRQIDTLLRSTLIAERSLELEKVFLSMVSDVNCRDVSPLDSALSDVHFYPNLVQSDATDLNGW
jgi:hypothetical protein